MCLVLLLGFLWGINWPAVKYLLTELEPFTIRAVAFPFASLLLAAFCKMTRQRLMPATRDWLPMIGTGLVLIFGFNVLSTFGQMLTEASRATIIAYTMPAITGVLAAVFLSEILTLRRLVSLGLGMLGLVVLASENFQDVVANPEGTVVMLLAALSWSIGNVALKARSWSIRPLPLTAWFFAISAVVCWPLAITLESPFAMSPPSPGVVAVWAYLIVGPMVICYAIWTSMVDRLPTTVAAISVLTAPVIGVISSALLIAEPLTWQKLVALALIVGSVLLTLKTGGRQQSQT